jgi:Na+-translocating ferredoxin:NAD+ oxidoreductase RnfE subunit
MPDRDTLAGRRRAGIILLIGATSAIAAIGALSAVVGNRTLFQYASPIFTVCFTVALILVTTASRMR